MITKTKQQGITMLGLLMTLGLIGFFSLIAIKLFPLYFEGLTAKSVIRELSEDPSVATRSIREIRKSLSARFDISQINSVKAGEVKIKTLQGGKRQVLLDYEVRTPFLGNVDLIVKFVEEVELPPQSSQ
ncbi:MAG: DUF4845 domain-containing protein [Pseudomonadota bacterium]